MPSALALWLPSRARLASLTDGARFAVLERALARGDAGRADSVLLSRHVDHGPGPWPAAAITRALDVGDAADATWLRADPAFAQAELSRARLLAIGEMGLDADDAEAFRRALAPLFGDEGFELSTPHPARWYLRALSGARLPRFVSAAEALGADLHDVMPSGEDAARWHRLLNETQMLLHAHPRNESRASRGLVPVNSLWFWGAGSLPTRLRARFARVASRDPELLGVARLSGARVCELESLWLGRVEGDAVIDLRHLRDLAALEREVLTPALAGLGKTFDAVTLALGEHDTVMLTRGAMRRFWRRARALSEGVS